MKKLLLSLFILTFMATSAGAEQLTVDCTATLTRSWINDAFLKLYNRANTGWQTDNIEASGITSTDIASVANPLVRDFYSVGEYVYSGLTIATSATLASTITAGVAFVNNDGDSTTHLVITAATAKTFTASKDTYVFLSYTGSFQYKEVANGAAQPSTDANYLVIAKVVTSGTAITSVTDLRRTTPTNMRIYTDIKDGLVISRDTTTATTIGIGRGEVELGAGDGGNRRNTATTNIDFTTTGEGGLDTGAIAANTYYYLYAYASSTSESGYTGIASTTEDAATVESNAALSYTPRMVGWVRSYTTGALSLDSSGAYRIGADAPNIAYLTLSSDTTTTSVVWTELPGTTLYFHSSGRPLRITTNWSGYSSTVDNTIQIIPNIDNINYEHAMSGTRQMNSATDNLLECSGASVILRGIGAGTHTAKLYFRTSGNTAHVIRVYYAIEEL